MFNLSLPKKIVIGGGNQLSRNLEKKYKDLGGKITYGTKVQKILTERIQNNSSQPNGIVLGNGKTAKGDIVVSCCDGFYTFNSLLNHNDPKKFESNENSFEPARDWKKFSTPKSIKYYSPKNFPKDIEMSFTFVSILFSSFSFKNQKNDILLKKKVLHWELREICQKFHSFTHISCQKAKSFKFWEEILII